MNRFIEGRSLRRPMCPICAGPPCESVERYWYRCASCDLLWDHSSPLDARDILYSVRLGKMPDGAQFDPKEDKIADALAGKEATGRQDRLRLAMSMSGVSGGALTEIGFGGAQALKWAKDGGQWSRVLGIEINSEYVAFACSLGLEAVYLDVSTKQWDPPGSFDLVFASEVMEHMPDPVAFVWGARRLLAPAGKLWLSFAAVNGRAKLDQGEWQYWSQTAVERLAEAARLSVNVCQTAVAGSVIYASLRL